MIEYKIIRAALSDRHSWETLKKYLNTNTLSSIGKLFWNEIGTFYEADVEAASADSELVRYILQQDHPKQASSIQEYEAVLPNNPSDINVVKLVVEQHKQSLAEQIAIAAGIGKIEDVDSLISKYNEADIDEEEEQPTVYYAPPLDFLKEAFSRDNLIPILPNRLNEALGGGLPRQSLVGIVARPDVGKTSVCINLTVGVCQAGYTVAYFGNEDPDSKMILRTVSRFLSVPVNEVLQDVDEAYTSAVTSGYDKFTFISLHPGTLQEIISHVDKIKPDVIIIDQLRNLNNTRGTKGLTEDLNDFAREVRSLIKRTNAVGVIVTQAGESAHNKLILDYNDVEYSNTGFAASLDLMIGVGQNTEFRSMSRVMLSFPKNKITGPLEPIEAVIKYDINKVLA